MAGEHSLFLDASGDRVQVALFKGRNLEAKATGEGETLAVLFQLVDRCLEKAGVTWPQIGEYLYGEGPGSTLGLRVAAMAVEIWRTGPDGAPPRIRPFNRLRWLAAEARRKTPGTPPVVAVPWKRKHLFLLDPAQAEAPIEGIALDDLELKERKGIAFNDGPFPLDLPATFEVRPYLLDFSSTSFLDYLNSLPEVDHATPFQLAPTEFKHWEGERFQRSS